MKNKYTLYILKQKEKSVLNVVNTGIVYTDIRIAVLKVSSISLYGSAAHHLDQRSSRPHI